MVSVRFYYQKQPSRGVLRKRYSEIMQQIYGQFIFWCLFFQKLDSTFSNFFSCFSNIEELYPFSGNFIQVLFSIRGIQILLILRASLHGIVSLNTFCIVLYFKNKEIPINNKVWIASKKNSYTIFYSLRYLHHFFLITTTPQVLD